ncbi:4-coumarate-CoA ligase-like protein [Amylocarpus encephaloides]|uniref:4-coumarate-CoA ligase-like protein n=1 Tax=Amylocarpus encephaloides TaxID=45428 RepID=A0A9P7YLI3_9HELO|nr:4-coumarate-CoA ligase-like protein [Amylocarpus encephaloides]
MVFFAAKEGPPIPTTDLSSWIFDNPEYDQDEPLYIDAKNPTRSLSLNQMRTTVRQLVAGLQAAGMKKGDCVCIHSFNDIYYSAIFHGIVGTGGIFAGTNPSYTQYELVHHIKTAKAKFLIVEPEIAKNALTAAEECNLPRSNIWIFDVGGQPLPSGHKSWKDLLKHGEAEFERFDDEETAKNTTAARMFSSGTTGLPKAAVLTHYNFAAQHQLSSGLSTKDWRETAHISVPKAGQISIVMRRFDLEEFLACIEKFEINELGIVPPIAIAIIMTPLNQKYSLKSVKDVAIGAAPLGRESQQRLKNLLAPGARVTQVWGMTEMTCVASMFNWPDDDDTGSVGRILPHCDAKIIDDSGNDISAYDTLGELCIRGPIVTPGYFENELANSTSFDTSSFFHTGDIVYCASSSQKWYIVDRAKELIKVRGFQVAPPEIENTLLSHPDIIDAAVIGVKDVQDEDVEHPRAYVVRRPGAQGESLDEKAVKAWSGERLARYKEITGGVRFVSGIPKNASGKILKRLLREEAKKERDAERATAKL